jgi:hypothetical protein
MCVGNSSSRYYDRCRQSLGRLRESVLWHSCAAHGFCPDVNTQACFQTGVGSRVAYMVTFVDSSVGSLNATTGVANSPPPPFRGAGYVCFGKMATRRSCKISGIRQFRTIWILRLNWSMVDNSVRTAQQTLRCWCQNRSVNAKVYFTLI